MLLWQYRFFCHQTNKLLTLQGQYRWYLQATKKVLRKNGAFPDGQDESTASVFPDGSRVYSSNAQDEQMAALLVQIDRSPEYLLQSTMAHLKEQQLESLVTGINPNEWRPYVEQTISSAHVSPVITPDRRRLPKKRISRLRTRRWSDSVMTAQKQKIGMFRWPIDTSCFWLSSFFGPRKQRNGIWRFHHGVDMASVRGTPVMAAAAGKIIEARYAPGYGNTVVIQHNSTYKTRYAHLDTISVKRGQQVMQKRQIGTVGDTGFTIKAGKDASHLHFEVYERGKRVNPICFLPSL